MAYRFTNTDKWQDVWFSNLNQLQMLLFLYLCDNCDIAGFIEINFKRWSSDLSSSKETIEGALKGLGRGLVFSNTNDCVFIRNFLKHQKNIPLNENNKAHIGIIRRFEQYAYKFDIQNINEFIEGASKGLQSPTGIGNGIGNDLKRKSITDNSIIFYKEILEKTTDENYKYFINFILSCEKLGGKPLSKVLNIEEQVTYDQFVELMATAKKKDKKLLDVLLNFENSANKKYKIAYRTLLNWMR